MRRRALILVLVLLLAGGISPVTVLASAAPPQADDRPTVHIVTAGETLASIARHYGVDTTTLAQLNDLADPRKVYAGQPLLLPLPEGFPRADWESHTLALAETFSLLARRSDFDWLTLARANRILNPEALLLGQTFLVPPQAVPLTVHIAPAGETWLTLALRHDLPYWELVRYNPSPLFAGAAWVVPGEESAATDLPYPLVALTLSPQPVVRGETSVLSLETAELATCSVAYLDKNEPCYRQDATHLFALLSLSPMVEAGEYTVALTVQSDGAELAFTLPLLVTPGRFGYERIDVSGSLSQLTDATLMETERQALDAVADLRTQQRFWNAPLKFPVQAAISSYFGSRRSYGGSYNTYHSGVDFRAGTGTPVLAPADGQVVLAQRLAVRGNSIMLDHGWGLVTGYWHLSAIEVAVGDWVTQGQVIGRVGNTGLSTGSHLHWEMWVDAQPVNPLQWVEPFYRFPSPPAGEVTWTPN